MVNDNYTVTIKNEGNFNIFDGVSNLFTISDDGEVGNLSNIGTITTAGARSHEQKL